jgi:hypothetical protein
LEGSRLTLRFFSKASKLALLGSHLIPSLSTKGTIRLGTRAPRADGRVRGIFPLWCEDQVILGFRAR